MEIRQEYLKRLPLQKQIEVAENVFRKDYMLSELVKIWDVIESHQGKHVSDVGHKLKRRDIASRITGIGHDKLSKARQIIKSGDKELIQLMDKTGNVNKAYHRLKEKQNREQILKIIEQNKDKQITDLFCGDFREVGKEIKDSSTDLVFTDPPYGKAYVELAKDLSVFCNRILRPGGLFISYCGHAYLPDILNGLSNSLKYLWIISLVHKGQGIFASGFNIKVMWKPILVFYKPPLPQYPQFEDLIMGTGSGDKSLHEQAQPDEEAEFIISKFSLEGQVICDPFAGSGTIFVSTHKLNRIAIGIELNQDNINTIKSKI